MVKGERVQNSYLYQKYTVRKIQMVTKNKGVVNERLLFHGAFCLNRIHILNSWNENIKHTNSGTRAALPGYIWDGLNTGGSILVSEKDITESLHTSQRKLHTVWLTSTE